ncbi:hypothetical protein WHR41_06595 [Cladosporium halotolerans]|uniref:Zn(2)-C6 fungal-type domain-containing protein n=1 Tax=Cladosporium halotolerans TaxID=1052096 RepID=A0AB34KL13_9PEZI
MEPGGGMSRHAPRTRATKKAQVRAACDQCRARKIGCDASRPACRHCRSHGVECVYATRYADETRQKAVRRENEALKKRLQEYQKLVDEIKSLPAEDALAILKSRSDGVNLIDSDRFNADWPQPRILARPPPSTPLIPLISDLQADLPLNFSKVYPKIVAFENPQSIAKGLLNPSGSHRLEDIMRMKLDLGASDSGKKLKAYLCDPRLQKLDISYWTDVPISSGYAAAVISHYLQTEHPSMALFDPGLFVGDLVGKRERFCSRLLVNAVLAYAIQAYEIFDSSAVDLHARFYSTATQLWDAETNRETFMNLAALKIMDYAGVTGGIDLEARRLTQLAEEMAETLRPSNIFAIANLVYQIPFPKPPLSLPIPGTYGFDLPWYMGSTFTSLCKLFVIAESALSHSGTKALGQVPFHIVEQAYGRLLQWAADLPSCCARSEVTPHHVMNMHVYYHCLVILLVRPWIGSNRLLASATLCTTPSAVFNASILQLKRIIILYQLHYPEARYHSWWNPAVITVSHAVLTASPVDPEWRFYLLICLKAYRQLALVYPFAAISYKAILTMAIAEGKLSGSKARDLYRQLFHGEGREKVRETRNLRVYMDLSHERKADRGGEAERLAGDFDRLSLVRDENPGRVDSAAEEQEEEWSGLQGDA